MDKRAAKRRAHKIVADLIDAHFGNFGEPFADNEADDERIAEALREISQAHYRRSVER